MATSVEKNIQLQKENQNEKKPFIEIIEEPKKLIRFRYACEGCTAGSIQGINSSSEKRTYPTIKINNCDNYKKGTLIVTCVTAKKINGKYLIHPHKINGKNSKKNNSNSRVIDFEINDSSIVIECSNLAIQHAKKSDVKKILESYEKINMDPFKAGFKHKNSPNLIDMKCVRFCFQATLTSDDGKKIITLDPVVSNVMNSILSKSLRISRLNICSAPASGGKEVTLLCDKVSKHDIKVLFYQQDNDSNIIWKKYAEIVGVHRQIGIIIVTPKYDRQLSDVIEVFIKLVRPSDGQSSEPRQFEITPNRLTRNKRRLRNDKYEILKEQRLSKKIRLQNNTNQCLGFRNISKAIYPRDVSTMSNLQFGGDKNCIFDGNRTTGSSFYNLPNFEHQQYGQFNFAPHQQLGNSQIAINQQNESIAYQNFSGFSQQDFDQISQVLDVPNQPNLPNQYDENSTDQIFNIINDIIPKLSYQESNEIKNDYSSQLISQENNYSDPQNGNNNKTQEILSCVDTKNINFDCLNILNDLDNLPILTANSVSNILKEINI